MYKKAISRKMHDLLRDHVDEMERAKERLVREAYAENPEKGNRLGAFFREYTGVIRNYLDSAEISKDAGEGLPFAIIGSMVKVQDAKEMESFSYRLVLPYTENPDQRIDCASCISPLGKALLLKNEGSRVNVEIPTGHLVYTIDKISFPESTDGGSGREKPKDGVSRSEGITVRT
jgi:transcription elongation factor GreA